LEIGETLYFTNRDDWRKWLEKNYEEKKRNLVNILKKKKKKYKKANDSL